MELASLHQAFLGELARQLPEWKFVARHRHFVRRDAGFNWFAHVAFINHVADFDAVLDVAVEFVSGNRRACIVGAEMGNIEGRGQVRYSVSTMAGALSAAHSAAADFQRVGLPFLIEHSNAARVAAVLRAGGSSARLISPIESLHNGQIAALEALERGVAS